MLQEKSTRKHIILPKVEGCIKFEIETQITSPKQSTNPNYSGEWAYTTRSTKSDGFKERGATTVTISSGQRIQLYTPMQESKRAQRLKNVPYQLQYFQTNLPTKNFTSSHLMSEDLLKQPIEQIENKEKWSLHSHISKMNNAFTQLQIKRFEKTLKKTGSSDDFHCIKKQNVENIEKEKKKRYKQYKQATQYLINQFTSKFNIKALYKDLQDNPQ